jgi:hypothetical protein
LALVDDEVEHAQRLRQPHHTRQHECEKEQRPADLPEDVGRNSRHERATPLPQAWGDLVFCGMASLQSARNRNRALAPIVIESGDRGDWWNRIV